MNTYLKSTVLLLLGALSLLSAAAAEATIDHHICAAVRMDTVDSDVGEDYWPSASGQINEPARWTKIRVRRGGQDLVPMTYADDMGCVTFESDHITGFELTLWGEALIPSSNDPAKLNNLVIRDEDGNVPVWTWSFDDMGTGVRWLVTNPSRRSNLLGLSSFVLKRWSDGLQGKLITVRDLPCPTSPDNSCSVQASGDVYIHPDHNQKKYVVAHELGHKVLQLWVNTEYYTSYGSHFGGTHCGSGSDNHYLHSKEYQSAAFNEGFAQFYASAVWNSTASTTGWFYYYKDFYKDGSVTFVDVENGPTGGTTKYMENMCEGTFDGMSTELDWMRAFWDYFTNAGEAPTMYQLLRQAKNGIHSGLWAKKTAYDAFNAGIAEYDTDHGTDFSSRWTQMATANGVDH